MIRNTVVISAPGPQGATGPQGAAGPTGTLYVNVEDYGAVGDGVANDATAIQAAITAAAASGGVVFFPRATYLCQSILTLATGVTLDLGGSTLKIGASIGASARLLTVAGVSNVVIRDGIIDGDKASFATATEQRHNIHITNSSNITLRDLVTKNAKGDGIYVGDSISGACSNVTFTNVTADTNHRQGLSVVAVDGLEANSCIFRNTSGTAPQAGVDIEPNLDTDICTNIKFVACEFTGNAGAGLIVVLRPAPSAKQGNVDIVACKITGNTAAGLGLHNSNHVRVIGGDIASNALQGVLLNAGVTQANTLVRGTSIFKNGREGIRAVGVFDGLDVSGAIIRDNSQSSSGTYMGAAILPASASTGFKLVGSLSGGSTQNRGLETNVNASGVVLVGNTYPGNANGTVTLADLSASRLQLDESGYSIPGIVRATQGLAGRTKAGIPSDADWTVAPPDGTQVLDTTNHRLYTRSGGVWKYAALT